MRVTQLQLFPIIIFHSIDFVNVILNSQHYCYRDEQAVSKHKEKLWR